MAQQRLGGRRAAAERLEDLHRVSAAAERQDGVAEAATGACDRGGIVDPAASTVALRPIEVERYLPASVVNLIATLEPSFTAVQAYFLLGERFSTEQVLGSLLILGGVIALRLGEKS